MVRVSNRNVEGGGKHVDLEPLNSDEKDLTNAIKVRVSLEHDLQYKAALF
jgi:hypothetical protein